MAKKHPAKLSQSNDMIILQGVNTHNLKHIDVELPKNQITTITGVSGSGKSSLAFDTIYKEGQFRYIESLSSYLRQFFNLWERPELDYSEWLSPAIAIEQNKRVGNSRSTVGTLTEIDDYLRLLMAKTGEVYCYACGKPLRPKTTPEIVADIQSNFFGQKVYLLQEMGLYQDANELMRFVRKNRKLVDQGGGITRYLLALQYDKETNSYQSMIEYFYLEEPNVSASLLPVKVYGIFDRVTINDATLKRLKDDAIKMLGRTEKFGVYVLDSESKEQGAENNEVLDQKSDDAFVMNSDVKISTDRKQQLVTHSHTADGFVQYTRALIRNRQGKILGMFDTRIQTYMLAWWKVNAGETVEEGLAREVQEELGVTVKQATYIGQTKVFFRLWAYVSTLFEVIIDGDPEIVESEQFSHLWRADIRLDKNAPLGVVITINDTVYQSQEELMNGGLYELRAYAIGLHESVADHDFPFMLPARDSIIPSEKYATFVDFKSKTYSIKPFWQFKPSRTCLLVTIITGDKILAGYDMVFGKERTQSATGERSQEIIRYTDKYYCPTDNISYPEFTTQHFSPNRQEGACPTCLGVGEQLQVDFEKVLDPFSPYLKAILPWRDSNLGQAILKKLAHVYQVEESTRRNDLPERFKEVVKNGDNELMKISTGGGKYISMYYKGVQDVLTSQYNRGILTVDFQAMLDVRPCTTCSGSKLRQESLHVFLQPHKKTEAEEKALVPLQDIKEKYNIFDMQSMSMQKLIDVIQRFHAAKRAPTELLERIVSPLVDRIQTIADLGLGYMITARSIDSLSGGEIQRLRLAKQLWNKLTGIIYVLDEPTIGLDEAEIKKVIVSIKQLKDMGNTIIVVEHSDEFIKASDRIIEVGPGAGDFGGTVMFSGPYNKFLKSGTLTAEYVTGKKQVTATFDHKPSKHTISIKKASKHNLKKIDVDIRLGSFTIITGPSGAGKTTLMYHTLFKFLSDKQQFIQSYIRLQLLKQGMTRTEIIQAPVIKREEYEHLEKVAVQAFYEHIGVETILWFEEIENVLYVDQSSIWKTPRSCPSTFIGVFDDIRKLYAGATEAKMLAFNAGHFSFNSAKGACPECQWYGYKKVELQFLPDTYVPCTLCRGRRYKPEILDIKRHGKSVAEVLEMYVMDAREFFQDIPFIGEKLKLMMEIGLGYLRMGQPAHTLSGGESQRLKLVKHLLKSYRGHTMYFLDEPTVWLHPSDIEKLLKVLKKFLDNGDTILMIEHEKNLLQFADQVVRLEDGKVVK